MSADDYADLSRLPEAAAMAGDAWDGVPKERADVDGWHWMQMRGGAVWPVRWYAEMQRYTYWNVLVGPNTAVHDRQWRYLGACLTPAEVAAALAAAEARGRMAGLREAADMLAAVYADTGGIGSWAVAIRTQAERIRAAAGDTGDE